MAIAALSVTTTESKATPVETSITPTFTQSILQNDTTPKAAPTKLKLQPAKKTQKEDEKSDPPVKVTAYNVSGTVNSAIDNDEPRPTLSATAEGIVLSADTSVRPELTIRAADKVTISKFDSTAKSDITFNGIYFYNGKRISLQEVMNLQSVEIKSMNVWKGESAIKKFGAIGANGVVELFSKKNPD
jgi:hypothetical protein